MKKCVAFLLCIALIWTPLAPDFAAAQDRRTPETSIDLAGTWESSLGGSVEISQHRSHVLLRTQTGLVFDGQIEGRDLTLKHKFVSTALMPYTYPVPVLVGLIGTELTIRGRVEDDGKITANLVSIRDVDYDMQSFLVRRISGERARPLTLTRRPQPSIVRVVPIDDISRRRGNAPVFIYPFNGAQVQGPTKRNLLIVGRNLKRENDQPASIESSDETIEYRILLYPGENPADVLSESVSVEPLYNLGLEKAFGQTPVIAAGLDIALVEAQLKPGVLPGSKSLTFAGAEARWDLGFADTALQLSFARMTSDFESDRVQTVYLPESVRVEIKSTVRLPADRVPVIVTRRRGTSAKGPHRTLTAERVSGQPLLYRTPPIEIASEDTAKGSAVPVAAGDRLVAELGDRTIEVQPRVASALVAVPANEGLWKSALRRTACGIVLSEDELQRAATQGVDEYSRVIVFDWPPGVSTVRIARYDHAAMLLLRDVFVEMTEPVLQRLKQVDLNSVAVAESLLAAAGKDPRFPLNAMQVWAPLRPAGLTPDGTLHTGVPTRMKFGEMLTGTFRDQYFKNNPEGLRKWKLDAVRDAHRVYTDAVDLSLRMARETKD